MITRQVVTAVILTVAIRAVPAMTLRHELQGDFRNMHRMASAVDRWDNIYAESVLFPYTPFSQSVQWLCVFTARVLQIRPEVAFKSVPILADIWIALLISFWPGVDRNKAHRNALFWAVNPVSILLSGFHGNIMPLVGALMAAATFMMLRRTVELRQDAEDCAALILGLAIAIRTFPLLLMPCFVLLVKGVRRQFRFALLASAASVLSGVPYLLTVPRRFLGELSAYSGFPDFGWMAAIRAAHLLTGRIFQNDAGNTVEISKIIFVAAYAVWLLVWATTHRSLVTAVICVPLLFYALYAGVSAQYLVWVLPVALATSDRMVHLFTAVATFCLLSFYATYHPGILWGQFSPLFGGGPGTTFVALVSNILFVLIASVWVVRRYFRER